jgi:hypothetical protein
MRTAIEVVSRRQVRKSVNDDAMLFLEVLEGTVKHPFDGIVVFLKMGSVENPHHAIVI